MKVKVNYEIGIPDVMLRSDSCMERVKAASPKLWEFVDDMIKDAVTKGYLEQ